MHVEQRFELRREWGGPGARRPARTAVIDGLRDETDAGPIEIDLESLQRGRIRRLLDRWLKRVIDVVMSATALALAAPLLIVIWAGIRGSSPGPAIYRHRRLGARGRYFDCYKFRTMVPDADQILDRVLSDNAELRDEFEQTHKLKDDPRVTRIGSFLRKTSIDEFPQFWNVLKGDMSIVGPRPIVTEEVDKYGRWLPIVLEVRPGITGLWQVSGRNDTTYAERVALDRRYALTRNIATDLRIMARTPTVMVKRNGAY